MIFTSHSVRLSESKPSGKGGIVSRKPYRRSTMPKSGAIWKTIFNLNRVIKSLFRWVLTPLLVYTCILVSVTRNSAQSTDIMVNTKQAAIYSFSFVIINCCELTEAKSDNVSQNYAVVSYHIQQEQLIQWVDNYPLEVSQHCSPVLCCPIREQFFHWTSCPKMWTLNSELQSSMGFLAN